MMDTPRMILYSALCFILFLLWQAYEQDYSHHATPIPIASSSTNVPELLTLKKSVDTPIQKISPVTSPYVTVETDVLKLHIDLSQGEVIQAALLHYPVSLTDQQPIQILKTSAAQQYSAKSQFVTEVKGKSVVDNHPYQTEKLNYQLQHQDKLTVVLKKTNAWGIVLEKTFIFKRGSYLIDVQYHLLNSTPSTWIGYLNTQLYQSNPQETSSLLQIGTYTGGSYGAPGIYRYKKVTFKDMLTHRLNQKVEGGWIAMQQHYFLTAWIPAAKTMHTFYTQAHDDQYIMGTISEPLVLQTNEHKTVDAQLYIGPEITSTLHAIAPGLDLTVDYGWFWFIAQILFALMKWINYWLHNWGWTIIGITCLIKLVFYRLSASSYRSMAGLRQLQPKLQVLKDKFGEDKAKLSQATMELYRQERINPFGGCLPILIQIPVFIALYWVLIESVELRQAPFIGWIRDLAASDSLHLLPIIMGGTMLIQQKLNPAPPDPMQAKMMMLLPVVFTAIFWNMPSGLVLYWSVNNVLSILQQWWITRKIEAVLAKSKR